MITIRRFLVLSFITVCCTLVANADGNNKSFKCENNTYSSTGRLKSNSTAINTGFNWTDSKGISYTIYMSASGSCYVIKTSKKTGKEYKSYLGSEISQDICKKLCREYKGKKK